jgi:hypothetical protein
LDDKVGYVLGVNVPPVIVMRTREVVWTFAAKLVIPIGVQKNRIPKTYAGMLLDGLDGEKNMASQNMPVNLVSLCVG